MRQSKKIKDGRSNMGLKIHPFSKDTKDVTLSIRLTEEARDAIKSLADSVGITYNRYIAKLVELHLEELEKEGKLPKAKPEAKPKKNGR